MYGTPAACWGLLWDWGHSSGGRLSRGARACPGFSAIRPASRETAWCWANPQRTRQTLRSRDGHSRGAAAPDRQRGEAQLSGRAAGRRAACLRTGPSFVLKTEQPPFTGGGGAGLPGRQDLPCGTRTAHPSEWTHGTWAAPRCPAVTAWPAPPSMGPGGLRDRVGNFAKRPHAPGRGSC